MRTCLSIAALLSAISLRAGTYYVDSRNGADSNAGTSPEKPWKYAPGMSGFAGRSSLKPGDTVYFSKDAIWALRGVQGLYLAGGVRYIGDVWSARPGSKKERATLLASDDLEAGVVRFRDHPTVPTEFRGFEVDSNHTASTGIDINHRFCQRMDGALKRVENVWVHGVGGRQSRNQFRYGIIVSNFGGDAGVTENVEIRGALVHDVARDGIALYPGSGPNDRAGRIRVHRSEVLETGKDPDYGQGHGITVKGWVYETMLEDNFVHHTRSAAIFVSGPEKGAGDFAPRDLTIRRNILSSQSSHGIVRFYRTGSKSVVLTDNLIYSRKYSKGLSLRGNEGALSLTVRDNIFINTYADLGGHYSRIDRLEFCNNIAVSSGETVPGAQMATAFSGNILARMSSRRFEKIPQ